MKLNKTSLFLIPLLLTGCAQNNPNPGGESQVEENCLIKEDTSIDFLCMVDGDYLKKLQSMVDSFMQEEPHVKVRLYNPLGSGDYSAIERVIVAGFFKEDYPDIAQCYPDNVVKYIAQGYAINVDNFLNNEIYGIASDKDDYISAFLEEGTKYTVEGTYSLPFCKSTELMYYNADALIGLDLSSVDNTINEGHPLTEAYLDNLTWSELLDKLCPAIYSYNESQTDENKIYDNSDPQSAVFTYDSDENFFITLANQYGYGYTSITDEGVGSIDFDNPGMRAMVKKLKIAKDLKYVQTRGSNYRDYVSNLFTARKALFTVSSTASLSYNYNKKNPFDIGVARLPHAENKEYVSINQGPSVCLLNHNDDNRSLASYLLWKHITTQHNSSSWSLATGYMNIRNSSYETEEYIDALNKGDDPTADLYDVIKSSNLKKIMEVKESTFNTYVFKGSSNARSNVGLLLTDALLSDGSDEAINDLFVHYSEEAKEHL